MRRPIFVAMLLFLAAALSSSAANGRVLKVLPHLLDLKGRHTLSPSLYERDAYQQFLRLHPEQRSGLRLDVQWKASGSVSTPLKLRIELRGSAVGEAAAVRTLEREVKRTGWFSRWTSVPLTGTEYKDLGELTAWRVTLWEGDRQLSEQKSFLW